MNIGLIQINNSFSGANYLPYSIGILQSYAQKFLKNPNDYHFMLPIYKRLPVEEAVQQLENADIVFFSYYVWNSRISREIARQLKEKKPKIITVFGGPHVPDRSEPFLRENRFIDLVCHNEGEQVFVKILESVFEKDWNEIPSISYIDPNNAYCLTPKLERLKDITIIPSPYLSGVFDSLMQANPKEQWLMMWETNRGCPFSCTFCDWGSATQSKVMQFEIERLFKEIEWCAKHKIEFIFCADANFGMLPRDLDLAQHVANVKKKLGYPQALSVQNTKNATERAYQVQKTLADAGLSKGVTIAFQSLDPTTLKNIKRDNISSESFKELQRRFTRDKIETYSDMLIALPGDTYQTFTAGVSSAISNGQHNRIQFGNLSILPNAEMGNPEYQKKYGMKTVQVNEVIFHGVLTQSKNEICETTQLVIETDSMPRKEWVKTRAFSWTTSLLHFDKLFQIPFVILNHTTQTPYHKLIEVFCGENLDAFPTLLQIKNFFVHKAEQIQQGHEEYCPAPEFLNIWWPADEYIFIRLVKEGKLKTFYDEAEQALLLYFKNNQIPVDEQLLHEAILLNQSLIKLPFQTENLRIELNYNIMEVYKAILSGLDIALEKKQAHYQIDRATKTWQSWDQWYKEVVWFGNKKGAYLYGHSNIQPELQGHY